SAGTTAAAAAIAPAPEQLTLVETPPAPPAMVGDAEALAESAPAALEPLAAEPATPATAEAVSAGSAPQPLSVAPEEPEAVPVDAPVTVSTTEAPAPSGPVSASPADLVRECARLLQAGSHGALLGAVEPVLKPRGRGRARAQVSYDRALLWAMVGLARKAGGDEPGARAAFDQGLRALPTVDMAEQDLPLFHIAETVGAQLLAGGEAAGDAAGSTVSGLRLSVGLLRAVAIAQPDQTAPGNGDAAGAGPGADDLPPWGRALRAHLAVERAREALAAAAAQRLGGFMERGDHAGGHRWLREALGWEELADRREVVQDAYWKPLGEEITRLGARALEPGAEAAAAMAALEHAEAVARALPPEALESPRMEEIRRRLWWVQTKLALLTMESGDAAGALDLLYRALRLAVGDPDRESETRRVLADALEAQAAGASERIDGLLRSGARAAAEEAGQELCRVIDRGLAEGVSQEELAGALSKRQHVMSRIAQAD
ncbi:MAG TPA: hypothetical protein VJU81_26565, partial [Methylomirabilota bacterium]|nr:hypothetical protein [Methylomirabilota bacterium]